MQDTGIRTTATSASEGRLKAGVGSKNQKRKFLKSVIKKDGAGGPGFNNLVKNVKGVARKVGNTPIKDVVKGVVGVAKDMTGISAAQRLGKYLSSDSPTDQKLKAPEYRSRILKNAIRGNSFPKRDSLPLRMPVNPMTQGEGQLDPRLRKMQDLYDYQQEKKKRKELKYKPQLI